MATDFTDPVVLTSLAQTIVLALTMVIFIFQFRSQVEATKDASYQKVLDDFTNSIALLVEKPELAAMIDQLGETSRAAGGPHFEKMTPEKSAIFAYMMLSYSMLERVYLLRAKRWIDEDTWIQWQRWLRTIAKHPMFQEVHRRSEGTFDKRFQTLVADAINANT